MNQKLGHNPGSDRDETSLALKFVILMGIVSLFSDFTYEGARSVIGPFLFTLGASGTVVGLVAGFGELIGYGLRLLSGYVADRTRNYWVIVFLGYSLNLLVVPLLALAGRWEIAAVLIVAERIGKAIRTPARDAMLSFATESIGRGWGFGLHEALDQIGAVFGPLVVAAVYCHSGRYEDGFAVLLIPALIALSVLFIAYRLYPQPHGLVTVGIKLERKNFPETFWTYLVALACVAAGYADFPLVAYHFQKTGSVPEQWIPALYSLAMGMDAIAALIFGRMFDRFGFFVLIGSVIISSVFAPLVFWGGLGFAALGMALWGVGMGAQESVMRAAIAGMVPENKLALAFGFLNTVYGVAWFVGSAIMGILYDFSVTGLVIFSVVIQLVAAPIILKSSQRSG